MIYLNEKITRLETTPVLTVEELKQHLRVPHELDDSYIMSLIEAATAYAERYTKRFLNRVRVEARFKPQAGVLMLRGGSVNEFRAQLCGVEVEADLYSYKAVTFQLVDQISYEAGYYAADVPADIKAALKLFIGSLYIQRADVSIGAQFYKCALTADKLLQFYKIP